MVAFTVNVIEFTNIEQARVSLGASGWGRNASPSTTLPANLALIFSFNPNRVFVVHRAQNALKQEEISLDVCSYKIISIFLHPIKLYNNGLYYEGYIANSR